MTQNNPGFAAEKRATDDLIPYARNSRKHSDAQLVQLVASMREWGFTSPVLVDEKDTILAGHGRVLAAKKLGMPDVPVIVARGWTEAQKRAYVIADNKLALNADWDSELLAVELQDLCAAGFEVLTTGFEGDELAALLGDIKPTDVNEDHSALETKYLLVVETADEEAQKDLFDEMQARGLPVKLMS
jgi:ParB-like chromosome segregation protein Spo0J